MGKKNSKRWKISDITRELEKEAVRKKDYDGKRLENNGHVRKITNTQTILGDGTYRILADLHYCRQTVKRDNTERIIKKNTKKKNL